MPLTERAERLKALRDAIQWRTTPPPAQEADRWVWHIDMDRNAPAWASKTELDAFMAERFPGIS